MPPLRHLQEFEITLNRYDNETENDFQQKQPYKRQYFPLHPDLSTKCLWPRSTRNGEQLGANITE